MSLRSLARITSPVLAFGAGFAFFPADWRKSNWFQKPDYTINHEALRFIEHSDLYKQLENDPATIKKRTSEMIPIQHRQNYVPSGILHGEGLFEIDPISFRNDATGEYTAFFHLGDSVLDANGKIHNGVTATILDEGLCSCGFAKLPSGKGVTASLSIDFLTSAPPNSTLVLRAKVASLKGRKVVIDGNLCTMDASGRPGIKVAKATCVLVEPKWFKYFRWLHIG